MSRAGLRATPATAIPWWSCTKLPRQLRFFSSGTGKAFLVRSGHPSSPFFEVKYPSSESKVITILNLLNHSSGLPDPSALTLMSWIHHHGEPSLNQTDFMKNVLSDYSRLGFEPGERAEYSNLGYMVLVQSLRAQLACLTRTTFADILRPLG